MTAHEKASASSLVVACIDLQRKAFDCALVVPERDHGIDARGSARRQ